MNAIGNPSKVKSVQRGVISLTVSTTATATISAVNTSKTMINYLGTYQYSGAVIAEYAVQLVLTNSTTVTATRGVTTGGAFASYEVIEYV